MKRLFFVLVPVSLMLFSCQNAPKSKSQDDAKAATESVATAENTYNLIGENNKELTLIFNPEAGIATAVFGSDTIVLNQAAMASGLEYKGERKNVTYTLTQWQGETTFAKDREILFAQKPILITGNLTIGETESYLVADGSHEKHYLAHFPQVLREELLNIASDVTGEVTLHVDAKVVKELYTGSPAGYVDAYGLVKSENAKLVTAGE